MWGMNECRRFISPKTILKGKQLDENSIWQLDDSEDTVFHQLLSLPTEEEIVDFVMQYASKRPKFRSDLMEWIKQHYLAPGEDCQSLTEEVERTFELHTYPTVNPGESVWSLVFDQVGTLLNKATLLLRFNQPDEALEIACAVLLQIGSQYEHSYPRHRSIDIHSLCETCITLIMLGIQDPRVSSAACSQTLQSVRQLNEFNWLTHYGVIDTYELMIQIQLTLQTPDEAIRVLDHMLEEEQQQEPLSKRMCELILWKTSILTADGQKHKVREVLRQYSEIPDIRTMLVNEEIKYRNYEAAIQLLNEGIRQARAHNFPGLEDQWLTLKLRIYQLKKDTMGSIRIHKLLFIRRTNMMEQYKALKRLIDPKEWPAFYKGLMQDAEIPDQEGYYEETAAHICLLEKDDARLFAILKSAIDCPAERMLHYAPYLRAHYSKPLLKRLQKLAYSCAQEPTQSPEFNLLVPVLRCMQQLEEGYTYADMTARELRQRYKNKRSLLKLLEPF